jgi:hypothetical protein
MQNFRYIGFINIDLIKSKINLFSENDWNEFDYRQKTFKFHENTQTIPLIFDNDFRISNPTYLKHSLQFEDFLNKIKKLYSEKFGSGFIIRAILVNLKANCNIPGHIDTGISLTISNRTHIPIITNDNVLFEVDNEIKQLKEGEIWEIDNTNKSHSVVNNSNQDRVHLIVDWIVE